MGLGYCLSQPAAQMPSMFLTLGLMFICVHFQVLEGPGFEVVQYYLATQQYIELIRYNLLIFESLSLSFCFRCSIFCCQ
jgi:hypothetical protein